MTGIRGVFPGAVVLLCLAACAPLARQMVAPAVKAVGEAAATDPDVAVEVERLLSTPEMRESLETLARAMVAGARDELAGPEWEALLRARSADLVEAMAPALARSLETELGPAMRRELARAIEGSLAGLASPDTQAALAELTRVVATAVTETLLLDPAPGAAPRPPLRRATEHVMLGVGDALHGDLGTSLHAFFRHERHAIAAEAERSSAARRVVLYGAVSLLAPAAVVLACLVWRKARAARRHDLAAGLLARACTDPAALDALIERVEISGDATLARYLREVASRARAR